MTYHWYNWEEFNPLPGSLHPIYTRYISTPDLSPFFANCPVAALHWGYSEADQAQAHQLIPHYVPDLPRLPWEELQAGGKPWGGGGCSSSCCWLTQSLAVAARQVTGRLRRLSVVLKEGSQALPVPQKLVSSCLRHKTRVSDCQWTAPRLTLTESC